MGIGIRPANHTAEIDSLLMSCRIIGRNIEFAFMDFIIDKLNNNKLNINVSDLIFEKPIKKKTYEDLKTKNFIPIIPEPKKTHLQNEFIKIENKTFKLNAETETISNLQKIISKLDINFTFENGFDEAENEPRQVCCMTRAREPWAPDLESFMS